MSPGPPNLTQYEDEFKRTIRASALEAHERPLRDIEEGPGRKETEPRVRRNDHQRLTLRVTYASNQLLHSSYDKFVPGDHNTRTDDRSETASPALSELLLTPHHSSPQYTLFSNSPSTVEKPLPPANEHKSRMNVCEPFGDEPRLRLTLPPFQISPEPDEHSPGPDPSSLDSRRWIILPPSRQSLQSAGISPLELPSPLPVSNVQQSPTQATSHVPLPTRRNLGIQPLSVFQPPQALPITNDPMAQSELSEEQSSDTTKIGKLSAFTTVGHPSKVRTCPSNKNKSLMESAQTTELSQGYVIVQPFRHNGSDITASSMQSLLTISNDSSEMSDVSSSTPEDFQYPSSPTPLPRLSPPTMQFAKLRTADVVMMSPPPTPVPQHSYVEPPANDAEPEVHFLINLLHIRFSDILQ